MFTHLQCVHVVDVADVVVALCDPALLKAHVQNILTAAVLEEALELLDAEVTVQRARALVTHEAVEAEHAEVD